MSISSICAFTCSGMQTHTLIQATLGPACAMAQSQKMVKEQPLNPRHRAAARIKDKPERLSQVPKVNNLKD